VVGREEFEQDLVALAVALVLRAVVERPYLALAVEQAPLILGARKELRSRGLGLLLDLLDEGGLAVAGVARDDDKLVPPFENRARQLLVELGVHVDGARQVVHAARALVREPRLRRQAQELAHQRVHVPGRRRQTRLQARGQLARLGRSHRARVLARRRGCKYLWGRLRRWIQRFRRGRKHLRIGIGRCKYLWRSLGFEERRDGFQGQAHLACGVEAGLARGSQGAQQELGQLG